MTIDGELTLYLPDGETLPCANVQGLTAVLTDASVTTLPDGRPRVGLTRLLTYFHSSETGVLISLNPTRENTGTLTGIAAGGVEALLPGNVTFDQYLLINLRGRLYANLEPLVMAAESVTRWPPMGTPILSQSATMFYDVQDLPGGIAARTTGGARPKLALAADDLCGSRLTRYVDMSPVP
ncbi:hypothetical protein [Micromonospora sp. NPDC126480]|uniref:hypothetical protein n=1 Tax=Micromonospora sp. NPDC126480 TaxID=3155312 RepID=UPI00332BEDE8